MMMMIMKNYNDNDNGNNDDNDNNHNDNDDNNNDKDDSNDDNNDANDNNDGNNNNIVIIINDYTIAGGFGEVIEAEILSNSSFTNKNINQINLPKTIKVGAILRKDKIIIPNSETIFKENDDVVFFSETKSINKLEQLLSIK